MAFFMYQCTLMSIDEFVKFEVASRLQKLLPGSAFGIPLTPTGPLVTDATVSIKTERQGVDYHTASDLINMEESERVKWTSLGPSALIVIRDNDWVRPDEQKTRFYLRPVV